MKIFKDFDNFLEELVWNIEDKRWGIVILKCTAALIVLSCAAYFLGVILFLIYENLATIALLIGCIFCIGSSLREALYKKREKMEPVPVEEEQNILQYDPITLSSTYQLLKNGLCSILNELSGVLGIQKVTSPTQLDSPVPYTITANVPIYNIIVPKISAEFDAYEASGIIQNAIEQRLRNNEFNGISQSTFFFNGRSYPLILVDKVTVYGNIVSIELAIANTSYCKYREQRLLNNMNNVNNSITKDKEF